MIPSQSLAPVPRFALTIPAFGGEACLYLGSNDWAFRSVIGTKDIIVGSGRLGFCTNFTAAAFKHIAGGDCCGAVMDVIQEGSWITDRIVFHGFRPIWKFFFPPGDSEAVLFVVGHYQRQEHIQAESYVSTPTTRQIQKQTEPYAKPPNREGWFNKLFKPKKLTTDDIFKEVAFQLVGAAHKHSTVLANIHRTLDEQKPDLWQRTVLMKMFDELKA